MKAYLHFIRKTAICLALLVIAGISFTSTPATAQDQGPEGYLTPEQWANSIGATSEGTYPRYTCYQEFYPRMYPTSYKRAMHTHIFYVKIYPIGKPNDYILYSDLGEDYLESCYRLILFGDYEGEGEMSPGEQYTIEVGATTYQWWYVWNTTDFYCKEYYYYGTAVELRVFADWNMDADFDDMHYQVNPWNEFINDDDTYGWANVEREKFWYGSSTTYDDACKMLVFYNNFTVPEDIEFNRFRIRTMAGYGYAYYYGYGYCYQNQYYSQYSHNANITGYYYDYAYIYGYPFAYYYDYGGTVDHVVGVGVSIKDCFPNDQPGTNILFADENYNDEKRARKDNPDGPKILFKNPSVSVGGGLKEGTTMTYQIYGPYPLAADESKSLVYEALDPHASTTTPVIDMSGSIWGDATYIPFTKARGKYATAAGAFKSNSGGEYQVRITIQLPGKKPSVIKKRFTVAWANDIAASAITSPLTDGYPRYYKYPLGYTIDAIGQFTNTGLNPIKKFSANCTIKDPDGTIVFNKDVIYDVTENGDEPLQITDLRYINFGAYKTVKTGQHSMVLTCELLSATDMETYNNRFMRSDMPDFTFATAAEYEGEAYAAIVPKDGSSNIVANRPFRPIGDFKNNGIGDIGDADATMTFKNKSTGKVFTSNLHIESLPAAPEGQNIRSRTFPAVILTQPGMYEATMEINVPDDGDRTNDKISFEFEVKDAVEGTFKIGTGGDFTTIDDAMEAIYLTGISGPIVFELLDSEYHVGNIYSNTPAWDFSTHIFGLSSTNTITIKPTAKQAIRPSGIKIHLYSGSGEGIRFGQNYGNKYKTAYINENISTDQREKYAENAGFIKIDGGDKKSLHFIMHTGSKKSVLMALYQGSHDITITNCVLENAVIDKENDFIPGTYYNAKDGNIYEKDYVEGKTYTAGIINRAKVMKDEIDTGGEQQATTFTGAEYAMIPNSNNTFTNNDISGFAFGVMSLGMGPVIKTDANSNKYFESLYNKNTKIKNNTITDCAKAGVYLGFEESAMVDNNLIVNTGGAMQVAGIALGGQAHGDYVGYNNSNITINNNRISGVVGAMEAAGIFVEQSHNKYEDPTNGIVTYPTQDNINIEGNAIWNVTGKTPEAATVGIAVMAERVGQNLLTMKNTESNVTGIKVINNSVIIDNTTQGVVWGLGVFNTYGTMIKNNAVSVKNNASNADINTALLYQNAHPKYGTITSNFNAVYVAGKTDAVRFIESKPMLNDDDEMYLAILNLGSKGEYKTLRNWLAWTGMDNKSVFGVDFMKDFNVAALDITLKPKVKTNILNNRGTILEGTHTDIHGVVRGKSDERFDIGAIEFTTTPYVVDYEACIITAPIAFREYAGKLSDAEYIMIPYDVPMSAIIRNNGSTHETNIPVTFTVYRENLDLNTWEEVSATTVTVEANKDEYAEAKANVNLVPKTYAEEAWAVPNSAWYGMEENVTPLYKVVVTVGEDLNAANNKIEQTYRFYVRRSLKYKIMQSNLSNVVDPAEVTGNTHIEAANAHAVTKALKDLALYNVSRAEAVENKLKELGVDEEYRQDVDVLNRNAWPARSISYDGYKTVVYSDGYNTDLTRFNKLQLIDFLHSGDREHKHNLIIASEEMVRNQQLNDWQKNIDPDLNLNKELRIEARYPYSPLGLDKKTNDYGNYSGHTVTGITAGGHATFEISSTEYEQDRYPRPGLFNLVDTEVGAVRIGMVYDDVENNSFPEGGRIMSNTFAMEDRNVTVMGVDWRHFADVSSIMKAAVDVMNSNGGIVNPVELYTFAGTQVANHVELTWTTASENGSSHFEVERANGGSFATISNIKAAGKSNILAYYNTNDNEVRLGETYTYRLKMVDIDGSFTYSNEVSIEIDGAGLFEVSTITPNPIKATANFTVGTTSNNNVTIELYDAAGSLVSTLFNGTINGNRTFEINAAKLASGSYQMLVRSGDQTATKQVTIVK